MRQRQNLAGRALLRQQAVRFPAAPDGGWRVERNAAMQPRLVSADGRRRLDAAIAHSRDLVACALSDEGPVGIDLEYIRPDRRFDDLASLAFGPRERKLCAREGAAGFYRLWTLREALAKARGIGFPLVIDGRDYFAGSPASGNWAQEIDGVPWHFAAASLPENYAFAVAHGPPPGPAADLAAALAAMTGDAAPRDASRPG